MGESTQGSSGKPQVRGVSGGGGSSYSFEDEDRAMASFHKGQAFGFAQEAARWAAAAATSSLMARQAHRAARFWAILCLIMMTASVLVILFSRR